MIKRHFTGFIFIFCCLILLSPMVMAASDNYKIEKVILKNIFLILRNQGSISMIKFHQFANDISQKSRDTKIDWKHSYIKKLEIVSFSKTNDTSAQFSGIMTVVDITGAEVKISCFVEYKQTIPFSIEITRLDIDVNILKEGDEELKALMNEIFAAPPSQEAQKPWSIYLAMGIEYRDNAALLPDGEHKPDDIEAKGDSLLTYSLGGNYDFYTIGKHKFTAGLYYTGIRHKELKSFDGDSVSGAVGWRFTEPRQYQLRTTVAFSHSWYGHDNYSNNFSITPGVSYFWNNWTWTDFDYSYSRPVYLNNPPSEADRGGQYHFFSLSQKFRHNSLLIDGKNTYWGITTLYSTSDTEGSDYDSHSYGLSLRVMQEFAWGITLSTSLARLKTNFEHVNSRSDDNSRRHDTRDSLFLRVSKKFKPWLYGYISYRYLKNNSNIEDYEYHTNNYSIGIGVEF